MIMIFCINSTVNILHNKLMCKKKKKKFSILKMIWIFNGLSYQGF